jgi:hypothetical protein
VASLTCHHHSTHNPPHKQLLVRPRAGGMLLLFMHHPSFVTICPLSIVGCCLSFVVICSLFVVICLSSIACCMFVSPYLSALKAVACSRAYGVWVWAMCCGFSLLAVSLILQNQLKPITEPCLAKAKPSHSTAQATTQLSCNSNSETGLRQLSWFNNDGI